MMPTQRPLIVLTCLATLGTLGLSTPNAHAQIRVALDIDYVTPVDSGPSSDGFGGQLRFGPRME
jgi:hypothetical protein